MSLSEIKLHKCLSCEVYVPENEDLCWQCEQQTLADLAIVDLLNALDRLDKLQISILLKYRDLILKAREKISKLDYSIR